MPWINGQKMACEPCIRGHRSTKCSHANERLMVPVRKPGRPLSSCPHLASRPCSCAAVTAAIPKKKQTCHCETSEPAVVAAAAAAAAVDGLTKTEESSAEASPLGASKGAGVDAIGHRVQKSITKGKQSKKPIDPAALERMDASQLNIVPTMFDAGSGYLKLPPKSDDAVAPVSGNAGFSTMGLVAPDAQGNILMYQHPLVPAPMGSPLVPNPSTNGHGHGHHPSQTQMNGNTVRGETPRVQSNIQMVAETNGNGQHKDGSKSCCCSNGDSAPEEAEEELKSAPEAHFQMNGVMNNSSIPSPMTMTNGLYPYMSPASVFAYPPQYGSYLQPLQPEQWRHLMATMTVGYQMPSMAYGMPSGVAMPPMNHVNGLYSHQCSCGDSCQCVGCAAHPYNEATQNYVRSAWSTMLEDSQKAEGDQSTPANRTPNNGVVDASAMKSPHDDTASSPVMPTPADSTSGVSEEQTLSASDFFFVSYPFQECEGEMASCPCGDDCACIGCAIHGNFASTQQPE